MERDSPYDEWSKNIHAVITFLKPFFDDWRSYASLLSTLLGVGVLIMENQVLLRMRMGRWEILGYILCKSTDTLPTLTGTNHLWRCALFEFQFRESEEGGLLPLRLVRALQQRDNQQSGGQLPLHCYE
ncbi:hypothetical protein BGZ75_008176 [Mortierella antarctica]|nr:hypothetical protein BGZ75_008176 [Mortierella antarctica]